MMSAFYYTIAISVTLSEVRCSGWTHSSVFQLEYYLALQFLACISVPHSLPGIGVVGWKEGDHC